MKMQIKNFTENDIVSDLKFKNKLDPNEVFEVSRMTTEFVVITWSDYEDKFEHTIDINDFIDSFNDGTNTIIND